MTEKISNTAVYQTREFHLFKILKYNRDVDDARVEKIMESIKKHGFLLPILVSEDMEIADGQHRFEAAKKLNIPILYIKYNVDPQKLPILVSNLNSVSKNWKTSDYYEMWESLGVETYCWIGNMIEKYHVTFDEINNFAVRPYTSRKGSENFKNGTFTLTENQRSFIIKKLENFNLIVNFNERFKEFPSVFRNAVITVVNHPDFNIDWMLERLKEDAGRILGCVNRADFVMQFEGMYNQGKRNNRIDFIKTKSNKRKKIMQKSHNGSF